MTTLPPPALVASVADRLRNHARSNGEDFQFILVRYGPERILYRLACSNYSDRFLLKGAMLFLLWKGSTYRPTKDLDLMSPETLDTATIEQIFEQICLVDVEQDGLIFDPTTVQAKEIREDNIYGGIRLSITAKLGRIRIPIQIDTGFADSVVPAAVQGTFPTILNFSPPVVTAYPPETVVAEKFEAMVKLGMANSRMKDFYDLWVLSQEFEFDGTILAKAIRSTFNRRQTKVPDHTPTGLSDEFFGDPTKLKQWKAFGNRANVATLPPAEMLLESLRPFLLPPCQWLQFTVPICQEWNPGGPWKTKGDTSN